MAKALNRVAMTGFVLRLKAICFSGILLRSFQILARIEGIFLGMARLWTGTPLKISIPTLW